MGAGPAHISNPIMTEEQMVGHMEESNEMFGFRSESRDGTLHILTDALKAATYALDFQTRVTEGG